MKSVFQYIDYRQFLQDYYKEKKAMTRFFSYRYFCRKAGISSPVFLKLVMDGKSNISVAMIDKFARALDLNKQESRFFKHLVLFNQSRNAEEKQDHYSVLVTMNNNVSRHVLGSEQFEYLRKWHTVVIRELICQYAFNDDFAALAVAVVPPISRREAESSVRLLLRLGLIVRQDDGIYRQVDRALATNREIAGPAIRAFNKTMIDLANRAVDTIENTERNVSGSTVGLSKSSYDILCAEIEAFKDRIATIVHNTTQADRVYQLNVQLFPVGRAPEVKKPELAN
ncbi:MAG: TIGR02147 family protein [Chitinivibrionales bacterium]|nr:TIGR02147 family protein [Chitinivibrionales bacterium]